MNTDLAAWRAYDMARADSALAFQPLPQDWAWGAEWAPPKFVIPHILMTDGQHVWLADWWDGAWRCCATARCIPSEAIGYRAFGVEMGDS